MRHMFFRLIAVLFILFVIPSIHIFAQEPLNNPCTGEPFTTIMTGTGLTNVEAAPGTFSFENVLNFELADSDEARAFTEFTETHIDLPLAVVLDGRVISIPILRSAITEEGVISGGFSVDNAHVLAIIINLGSVLPIDIQALHHMQTLRTYRVVYAPFDSDTSPELIRLTADILRRRAEAYESATVVTVDGNEISIEVPTDVTLTPDTRIPDLFVFLDQIDQTGLIEFVDFSSPEGCTRSMPIQGYVFRGS
jgi:hypothetical protein